MLEQLLLRFTLRITTIVKPEYHRHCCPACGQRVSWSRLNIRAWTWARWKCESCGTELKFSSASRRTCGLLLIAWLSFLSFFVLGHVTVWVYLVIATVGGFAIFRLDRIVLTEPVHSAPERDQLHALRRDASYEGSLVKR